MRRRAASTTAVALVALLLGPAALGHEGGGAAKGYASNVTAVQPAAPSLRLAVLDGDDRLQLRVDGPQTVVIHGYEGEPYLRFSPEGVDRNRRSPATYLNDDRYGKVRLPADADPDAPPEWERVGPAGRAYEWHDHRIHWMSPTYPPVVEAAKDRPHHVFDWKVPGTLDGRPLEIRGSLDYTPLPGQRFPKLLIVPVALVAVLGVALILLRRRRERRRADAAARPDGR
jgi:hypothetical protein